MIDEIGYLLVIVDRYLLIFFSDILVVLADGICTEKREGIPPTRCYFNCKVIVIVCTLSYTFGYFENFKRVFFLFYKS